MYRIRRCQSTELFMTVFIVSLSAITSGSPVPAAPQCLLQLRTKLNRENTYVLAVTTGHSGSTSISNSDGYAPSPKKNDTMFNFENLPLRTDKWKTWWFKNPSEQEQIEQVRTVYKRWIDTKLAKQSKSIFVDLGHHAVEGIFQVAPLVFGENLFMIRVRRSRLDVAHSFSFYRRDLCKNMFTICPLRNTVMLQPAAGNWTKKSWRALSFAQQAFWYIDEVEAQWQRMLLQHPNVRFLQCEWSNDLRPCFEKVASALGLEVAQQTPHDRVHENRTVANYTWLQEEDMRYRKIMFPMA